MNGGSSSGPNDIVVAIEQYFNSPTDSTDVVKKLRKVDAPERHVFLWVKYHRWREWRSLFWGDLPSRIPQLPDGITAIWVAAIGEASAWLYHRDYGWREIH